MLVPERALVQVPEQALVQQVQALERAPELELVLEWVLAGVRRQSFESFH